MSGTTQPNPLPADDHTRNYFADDDRDRQPRAHRREQQWHQDCQHDDISSGANECASFMKNRSPFRKQTLTRQLL